MASLGPPSRRRWRRQQHIALFWTTIAVLAALLVHELDPGSLGGGGLAGFAWRLGFALVPVAPLGVGLAAFLAAVRSRLADRLTDAAAEYLRERLSREYVVLAHYAPRDTDPDEVKLVVLGPAGVFVIEPRDEPGRIICYQDHWYRRAADGSTRALGDAPSKRAHHDAGRVRSDVATGGFLNTGVEAFVVFTRGQLEDVASSCVPVFDGMDALVGHLARREAAGSSRPRTSEIAEALVGPIRLAVT